MAQPLVELRCGKLVRDGTILKADPRKGMVGVVVDDQDLIHFQWAERTATGTLEPESDQIIFAGEASFEKASLVIFEASRKGKCNKSKQLDVTNMRAD